MSQNASFYSSLSSCLSFIFSFSEEVCMTAKVLEHFMSFLLLSLRNLPSCHNFLVSLSVLQISFIFAYCVICPFSPLFLTFWISICFCISNSFQLFQNSERILYIINIFKYRTCPKPTKFHILYKCCQVILCFTSTLFFWLT